MRGTADMTDYFRERLQLLLEEARDKNYKIGRKGFAEKCGVKTKRMCSWLEGKSRPDYETLIAVAHRLDVTAAWLIGATDERKIILPPKDGSLPEKAQDDYRLILDYLQFKHGIELQKPNKA